MQFDKDIITKWKKYEKSMLDKVYADITDDIAPTVQECIQQYGPRRLKISIVLTDLLKKIHLLDDETINELNELSWGEATRYHLALKLAKDDEKETERIKELKKWLDASFTAGMVLGLEKDKVASENLNHAVTSYLVTNDDGDFLYTFLDKCGFGEKGLLDNLPPLTGINTHIRESFSKFISTLGYNDMEELLKAMNEA